ncbi:hypothetical protein ELX69_17835 [Escherichia coli]|nr:hypothetical protein [Salmonella enterica]TFN24135.1 hypothetical protein ELX69_26070 [Escherichia coli]TFN33309.1 hypothetical protein ELX69_17835 [Escherichia coli]
MAFFYVHYVLIYQTVTSLTYVFVPLDFRPHILPFRYISPLPSTYWISARFYVLAHCLLCHGCTLALSVPVSRSYRFLST